MTISKKNVIAKAVENIKESLLLSSSTIQQVIENDKDDGKALLLIRIYRSLFSLFGGDEKAMRHWLITPNLDFDNQPPIESMKSLSGLMETAEYLDEIRGH